MPLHMKKHKTSQNTPILSLPPNFDTFVPLRIVYTYQIIVQQTCNATRTSREKLIPGTHKMLIPGEFGFAGGNVLSLSNLHCAPGITKLPPANLHYAPGIKVIPGELKSGSPGIKIQKIKKNPKIQKKI
jgi:hypothetical protein